MSSVSINGVTFYGNNIAITGTSVVIDGKDVSFKDSPFKDEKVINIMVDGGVNSIDINACQSLTVNGDVNSIATVSGDVYCGNVLGNVKTVSGDVECNDIGGSVTTVSGDVK